MSEIRALPATPAPEIPAPDWYADFFTELPNEFWRRAAPPESAEADIDFVERRLGLSPGSRIVDVPCGSGRHSLASAARGHLVTGIDISSEAIAHARQAATDAGLDIDLAVTDMRDIPRSKTFDAAICMGNSFGYLEIDGVRQFLAGVAAVVRPSGGMVIDFNAAAETILPGFRGEPRISRNCCPTPGSPTLPCMAEPTANPTNSVHRGCSSPPGGRSALAEGVQRRCRRLLAKDVVSTKIAKEPAAMIIPGTISSNLPQPPTHPGLLRNTPWPIRRTPPARPARG